MQNNCMNMPCIYHYYTYSPYYEDYCLKRKSTLPQDIDEINCGLFQLACTCLDCKHAIIAVYETGTIDDIEYRCKLQNNKLIYDDSNPYNKHYKDIPKCNINKFELEI